MLLGAQDANLFAIINVSMETTGRTTKTTIFSAEIIAGSLMLAESRKIACLLLDNIDEIGWNKAIVLDNVLQKKSIPVARRQAKLIRNRLTLMTPELWKLVADGTSEIATQALLAAAIKHSRLIGDLLLRVIKQKLQVFDDKMSTKDWTKFLTECEQLDSSVAGWTESTRKKLGSVLTGILTEAHYLNGRRIKKISPVFIAEELRRYLVKNNEQYILNCMEIDR